MERFGGNGGAILESSHLVRKRCLLLWWGLIARMHGGGWYARTTDLFDMPRLTYDQ